MVKRVLIGLIALTGLLAVDLAIERGDAEAQSCLRWATAGGSRICCAWSPKGLEAQIKFDQDCPRVVTYPDGDHGSPSACAADVDVVARDSVAFCQVGNTIVKVPCEGDRRFNPVFETLCEGRHDKDANPSPGPGVGTGHEANHGECTQRIVLAAACQDCCTSVGGTCLDVTPIEFEAQVRAFNPTVGGDLLAVAPSEVTEPSGECPPNSPLCVFNQTCSINPNKLKFIPPTEGFTNTSNQTYQCDYSCVGSACPPPTCDFHSPGCFIPD